jgi:tRNA(Ile)-lysidine synthase
MEEMQLIAPSQKGVIAISGGLDSMCLALVLASHKHITLEALHINHGTRKENKLEEQLVVTFCEKLKIKCHVVHLQMSLQDSNFENKGRLERQKIFLDFVKKDYYVYTAHHLDDSFEWSLMQSFKQSSLKSTLGIPVYSNGICRPFLCVSKQQLLNYAQRNQLVWVEDKSNQNIKFERNALRILFNQALAKRYQGHLRHYVNRQNQLAHLLKLHRLTHSSPLLIENNQGPHCIELQSSDFRFHKEKVRDYIHYFSHKKRGEIEKELEKLIQCHRSNIKIKMHGPFSFSGGVKAYLLKDSLFICHQEYLEFYQKLDIFLSENLSQIHRDIFPHLIILKPGQNKYISKLIHPLLPLTIKKLKENRITYSFLPLHPDLLD